MCFKEAVKQASKAWKANNYSRGSLRFCDLIGYYIRKSAKPKRRRLKAVKINYEPKTVKHVTSITRHFGAIISYEDSKPTFNTDFYIETKGAFYECKGRSNKRTKTRLGWSGLHRLESKYYTTQITHYEN